MSRRTLVGGLTDGGVYVTYVHNGGCMPTLRNLIQRDGVDTVLGTLLTARDGGWSLLNPREDGTDDWLGDRGRAVPGYGVAYTDNPGTMPVRFPEAWSDDYWADAVYLLQGDGSIRWAVPGDDAPDTWAWRTTCDH